MIQPSIDWIKRVVTQPRSELTRWQRTARFTLDLCRFGARQLREDNAPQMAGALAFRTLFGMLPVMVVGTIMIRAFRGTDEFMRILRQLMSAMGLDEVRVLTGGGATAPQETSASLSHWLLDLISQAQTMNLAAIGWIGVVVLAYSAIGLMLTIENSFNAIYRSSMGRFWTRRLPLYWTLLTLGPLAIGIAVYAHTQLATFVTRLGAQAWLLSSLLLVFDFSMICLSIFLIYRLVPSASVSVRSALSGAFLAGILLELGWHGLGVYLENALSIRQLYGSLGLIPLFMFWVYTMWLIVLFGLEVSATLQMLPGHTLEEIEKQPRPTGVVDPAMVVLVMQIVAERFDAGETTTRALLHEESGIPDATLAVMLERLCQRGLIHRVEGSENVVSLARPRDGIAVDELMDVGFGMADSAGSRPSDLVFRLRAAQRSLASDVTLAAR